MTDNQDSVTAGAVQPPTDRPLTAGDYECLADLHTIKGWLHGLATNPALNDVVADGGVTTGDCYQQEAREFAGRIGRIIEHTARPATSAASEGGWSPVNVNDTVQVRLTDLGRETRKAYWEPFSAGNYRPVKVDGDGWSEFQLWDLMVVFGPRIRMGMDVPFETTIRVKTPALASPPVSERERELEGALRLASDLHAAYEQLIYGLPKYLESQNLTDEENMIREAYITLDVTAHRLAALTAQPAGEGK